MATLTQNGDDIKIDWGYLSPRAQSSISQRRLTYSPPSQTGPPIPISLSQVAVQMHCDMSQMILMYQSGIPSWRITAEDSDDEISSIIESLRENPSEHKILMYEGPTCRLGNRPRGHPELSPFLLTPKLSKTRTAVMILIPDDVSDKILCHVKLVRYIIHLSVLKSKIVMFDTDLEHASELSLQRSVD